MWRKPKSAIDPSAELMNVNSGVLIAFVLSFDVLLFVARSGSE